MDLIESEGFHSCEIRRKSSFHRLQFYFIYSARVGGNDEHFSILISYHASVSTFSLFLAAIKQINAQKKTQKLCADIEFRLVRREVVYISLGLCTHKKSICLALNLRPLAKLRVGLRQ